MTNKRSAKIHFNRISMQRNDPNVWSTHVSGQCFLSEKILIMKDGEILMETVFKPGSQQPRAYFKTKAKVRKYGNTTVVEV